MAQNTDPLAHSTPAHRYPPGSRQPQGVRIGRGTFPFTSYSHVSAAYRATIERLNLGVSEAPACEVLNGAGCKVAEVAYNGRVFGVGADGEVDHNIVLHETRDG